MSGARGTLQPSPVEQRLWSRTRVSGRSADLLRRRVGRAWERNGPTPPLTAVRRQPTAPRLLMARANGC